MIEKITRLFNKKNKEKDEYKNFPNGLKQFHDEIQAELNKDPNFRWVNIWHTVSVASYCGSLLIWLIFGLTYTPNQAPELRQVVQGTDGKLVVSRIITFPTPPFTDTALREWVNKAMNNVLNFSPLSFKDDVIKAEPFFCADGYRSYQNFLNIWNVHGKLVDKNQIQKVTVMGQLIMIGGNKGFEDALTGDRYWKVQVPANVATIGSRTVNRSTTYEIEVRMQNDNNGKSGFCINGLNEK